MTATVIVPTTGSEELVKCVESVLNQSYLTDCYVVCDGIKHFEKVANTALHRGWNNNSNFKFCCISDNVGANGFYGHRIYAAFTHLVNTDYVLYLDQDNWIDSNHVLSCVENITNNNLDWTYTLRKICDKDGQYICNDDCESLGKWPVFSGDYSHIDTNCYCLPTENAIRLASVWHGGWGQDRVFFSVIKENFRNYDTTGLYTVNYRVGGNEGSVKSQFFQHGNEVMKQKYGSYPWRKI